MHSTTDEHWIENLNWPEIERRIAAGALGILPVGAACKEHGRHLPMNTDFRQASWLASQTATQINALVWPVLGYGYYPSFIDYPGSVSVPDEIFAETARAVIAGMAFSGVKRIVVINTGISTIAPLESALRGATWQATVILHNAYAGPKFTALEQRLSEQTFGGHADEIETSIMLALDESVVDMDVAKPQPTRISRGLFNRSEPDQANYSPDGVNGDPTLATREKGQLLLRALSDDCLAVCDKG